jgi:hypothetical protein
VRVIVSNFSSSINAAACCYSACPRKKNTHRDLDGHLLIDTVLKVEVNAIDTESLEASLTRCPDVRRVPADLGLAVVADGDAELGGQLYLLPDCTLHRLHIRNQKHCIEYILLKQKRPKKIKIQNPSPN